MAAVSLPPFRQAEKPEATSLLGKPLFRPPVPEASRAKMEADAAAAFDQAKKEPSADAIIWLGRRTAYLGKFREAIEVYGGGMRLYPEDPRLYRHRGHRYITVRQLDQAIGDLAHAAKLISGKADEVEPDGQPNARGTPTSTLHSNIWYHLALARYLKGEFAAAADDWRRARDAVKNPDNLVAASAWMYTALRRANRAEDAKAVLAPIRADLDVIENTSYHSLLLMYKGEKQAADLLAAAPEGASGSALRYGVSAWYLANGQAADARKLWEKILAGPDWPSFGYVAAEADMARQKA
jgi:tetratricopeptide (TPR) repeat protein